MSLRIPGLGLILVENLNVVTEENLPSFFGTLRPHFMKRFYWYYSFGMVRVSILRVVSSTLKTTVVRSIRGPRRRMNDTKDPFKTLERHEVKKVEILPRLL